MLSNMPEFVADQDANKIGNRVAAICNDYHNHALNVEGPLVARLSLAAANFAWLASPKLGGGIELSVPSKDGKSTEIHKVVLPDDVDKARSLISKFLKKNIPEKASSANSFRQYCSKAAPEAGMLVALGVCSVAKFRKGAVEGDTPSTDGSGHDRVCVPYNVIRPTIAGERNAARQVMEARPNHDASLTPIGPARLAVLYAKYVKNDITIEEDEKGWLGRKRAARAEGTATETENVADAKANADAVQKASPDYILQHLPEIVADASLAVVTDRSVFAQTAEVFSRMLADNADIPPASGSNMREVLEGIAANIAAMLAMDDAPAVEQADPLDRIEGTGEVDPAETQDETVQA